MSEHDPTEQPAPPRRRRPLSGVQRTLLLGGSLAAAVITGALLADGLDTGGRTAPPDGQAQQLEPVSGTESTPLPEASLDGFDDDEPVTLSRFRGTPLVVNFWATWCTPCVVEMPAFNRVAGELEGEVVFLGVNSLDRAEEARKFVDELGIGYELASDPDGALFDAVGGFGWPTTLLVDPDGVVRYRHTGPLEAPELRDLLATHLDVER